MKDKKKSVGYFSKTALSRFQKRIDWLITKKGYVKPIDIVEDSKRRDSPFRGYITWDDDSAAQNWRIKQARDIINNVTVIVEKNGNMFNSRAFFNVNSHDKKEGSIYVTLDRAMNDAEMRMQLLKEAIGEIECWTIKYRFFKQFNNIRKEVRIIKKKVK